MPTVDWWLQPAYWLSRLVFARGLAAIYLIAFLVAVNQFRPLLGESGLLPAPRFLARVPFRLTPSLFHLRYSDRLLAIVAWLVPPAAHATTPPRHADTRCDTPQR